MLRLVFIASGLDSSDLHSGYNRCGCSIDQSGHGSVWLTDAAVSLIRRFSAVCAAFVQTNLQGRRSRLSNVQTSGFSGLCRVLRGF